MSSSVVALQLLGEQAAPLHRDALDACLDRDAAGATEEVEHLVRPVVDAQLHAELDVTRDQRLEERAVGEEDLVDEVDVADAARR